MAVTSKRRPAATHNGEAFTSEVVVIPKLQQKFMPVTLVGISPYMQLRFSEKSINKIRATQEAGQQARSRKTRQARDFDDDYHQAMHRFADGRHGIPCSAFRNAMISACRLVGFKMTIAKLTVFIVSQGGDIIDGTPLVEIQGTPEPSTMPVRNATGVIDLRVRPIWPEWRVQMTVRWDAAQFSERDIVHLLDRAGQQVGVGEGRPDSRESAGLGYGLFRLEELMNETEETPRG
jgi:hypothetical protein